MGEEVLSYELLKEEGPDHNKIFQVCAKVGDREIGRGTGRTKKAAEALAAYRGILFYKKASMQAEPSLKEPHVGLADGRMSNLRKM